MRTGTVLIALAVVLAALLACDRSARTKKPLDPAVEEPRVRACFEAYKRAILTDDGKAAAELVDSKTIAWFEECREAALHESAAKVRERSLMVRFQVLLMRHRIGQALKEMDGKSVLIHAVTQGWVGKASASDMGVARIVVNDTFATGEMKKGEEVSPVHWRFVNESGSWRLELLPLLKLSEPGLLQAATAQKMNEDEFMVMLMEAVSGRKVPPTIWDPLQPAPPGR